MTREMNQASTETLNADQAVRVAEYVCGLLDPTEHAQVHALLSRDDQALGVALAWEEELLTLVDALPPIAPSPALRDTLQRTLGIGPPPAPSQTELLQRRSQEPSIPTAVPNQATASKTKAALPNITAVPAAADRAPVTPAATATSTAAPAATSGTTSAAAPAATSAVTPAVTQPATAGATPADSAAVKPGATRLKAKGADRTSHERTLGRKLWVWRLIGLTATAAAIVGFMLPGEPPPPPVQIVKVAPTRAAILMAPGTSSTPAWTATFDTDGNLMMQPLVQTEVPVGNQTLLWTRSARVPEPRLLGSIDPNRPVQVPAARFGVPADDQLLEITLETDEDAVRGVPNGRILFIGQVTTFSAEASAITSSSVSELEVAR